jgi:hypothetical protein
MPADVSEEDIAACHLFSRWFLAELIFFDPEDGGDMFLRNVG